jgi:hypothetical protein
MLCVFYTELIEKEGMGTKPLEKGEGFNHQRLVPSVINTCCFALSFSFTGLH